MQTLSSTKYSTLKRTQHPSNTKQINDYLIDLNSLIGEGSFSRVYKATNLKTNQLVAVKIVELSSLKTDTLVKLLQSEIDILKIIKHPNVLTCHQVLSSSNNCYIVTEYCNGGDLESYIRKHKNLSEKQLKKIIWESFQGLKYLSSLNIIHRDFKIANIFLNNGVAKLADFGFAQKLKFPDERFTDVNIGSPVYMAPQAMIQNIYGPKTDVWSFGIFLYQILHGDTPLGYCQTQQQLYKGARKQLTDQNISPNVPAFLRVLILQCLQVDERKRLSVAQIANEPYMLQIQKEFVSGNIRTKQTSRLQVPINKTKSTQELNDHYHQSPSMLHSNMQSSQRTIPYLPVGPSVNSQIVIQGNIQSRLDHLNNIVPSSHSQLVILDNRSSQNIMSNKQIVNPTMSSSINHQVPQSVSFLKHRNKPSSTITTTINNGTLSNISPTNLVRHKILFSQCVQLLHYCRLMHKCIINGAKINSCAGLVNYLSGLLLSFAMQLKLKCITFVQFDGQRASLRQKKLSELVDEYYTKYKHQLKTTTYSPTYLGMYALIKESLIQLDKDIHLSKSEYEVDTMVRQSHLLLALYQISKQIDKASESGDFSRLALLRMDDFLNKPNEAFNWESYKQIKAKLISLQ